MFLCVRGVYIKENARLPFPKKTPTSGSSAPQMCAALMARQAGCSLPSDCVTWTSTSGLLEIKR